jgi:hypothetical protein
MTPKSPTAPLERLAVIEEEVVLRGGAGTVRWLVRHHDGWVRAPSHPSAQAEQLERGSGIVWRTRITLELSRGSELTRVETRPEPRPKTALDHLTSSARGAAHKTLRHTYRVGAGGELLADKPDAR